MPHMMPMLWLLMLISILLVLMMIISMIYFFYSPPGSLSGDFCPHKSMQKKWNWKW